MPKYSIQVRPAGAKLLEVINIAEIDRNAQININEITYGEVKLLKIFKDNKKQGTDTFVTFKASKVIKPLSPKYIAYSDHKSQIPDCVECKFKVNEKLRNYIKPSDSDYEKLYQFARFAFSDNLNWTEVNDTVVLKKENKSYKHRVTPGEIYGIINLELPYSNAFRFFIEQYPKLLSGFCKHIQSEVKCKKLDNI